MTEIDKKKKKKKPWKAETVPALLVFCRLSRAPLKVSQSEC